MKGKAKLLEELSPSHFDIRMSEGEMVPLPALPL